MQAKNPWQEIKGSLLLFNSLLQLWLQLVEILSLASKGQHLAIDLARLLLFPSLGPLAMANTKTWGKGSRWCSLRCSVCVSTHFFASLRNIVLKKFYFTFLGHICLWPVLHCWRRVKDVFKANKRFNDGQTGSLWLPAKSAVTLSNWTFCSYMIPDEKI